RRLRYLKSLLGPYKEIKERHDAVKELSSIVEPDDEDSVKTFMNELSGIREDIDRLEFKCLLGEEADSCGAIVNINSGAGGTESCDWASMLMRMYIRWAEDNKFAFEVVDQLNGEEAGIKSATIIIRGEYAFGYLKSETGVHRLVRISPFDSNKRRHTSFSSVDVIPDVEKEFNIDVNENDLKIDTFRSGGAGGQHVNKTESAIRITHLPSGIVVQCQNERSQHKNKATAMKLLKARLYEMERRKQDAERLAAYGNKMKIEWGSQIRSYVLHPYKMVKDHRTEEETSSADSVLDGKLYDFMLAYLKARAKGGL
ncbi:MAG: peptide chain release factor 2, partial [Candidatus Omnitrophica bacterium]|nr:peptide chain release factor 2 [Candidatus Omnitrophota bacterium]